MSEEKYRKEREYSRVDAYLPLRVRKVPPEERDGVRSRSSKDFLLTSFPPLPDLDDSVHSACIRTINAKLDAILNALRLQQQDRPEPEPSPVNISGSGLRFCSSEPFAAGDLLEVGLVLPSQPDVIFFVYGEVVRCEPELCTRHNVCLMYTVIDEDIRAKIVKFVFERQRELIRKQRRQ